MFMSLTLDWLDMAAGSKPWSQSLVRFAPLSAKISLAWLVSEGRSWATADAALGFEGVEAARETVGQEAGVGTAAVETAGLLGLARLVLLRSLSLDENAMRVAN
jgi:hypothetical protein